MWSVLDRVPCALEKNVYSEFCGCNVLKISIKSNCSVVPFRIFFALLIFYLEDLSTDVSRVLKSPAIVAVLSMSHKHLILLLCLSGKHISRLPNALQEGSASERAPIQNLDQFSSGQRISRLPNALQEGSASERAPSRTYTSYVNTSMCLFQ